MPSAQLNPNLARVFAPPVMEARRWVAEAAPVPGHALLNLSQAAPVDPPPPSLRRAMAAAMERPETHLYGPVLGDTALRAAVAAHWSGLYGGTLVPEQVAITAGCNQAFCTAISSVCAPGDGVLLPVPWYFNHRMWLEMSSVETQPLACDAEMLPDLDAARAAITPTTRAIVLVTPNNPTGAEYSDTLLHAFYDLAREHGLALILDETYRDFHAGEGAPHTLFSRPDWPETLIHLYSFSKVYRLTGHRTGALICGEARLTEAEKILDSVTICPPRLGQIAALEGLATLAQWVAGERAEILARRAALAAVFSERLADWRILGLGAYFAYVEHPYALPSDALAKRLVEEAALLVLPGTMFTPAGDPQGARQLRIAFANADATGLRELGERLAGFTA
ncbi:MAG: aminotransferase [Pseudomonadota bacterium]